SATNDRYPATLANINGTLYTSAENPSQGFQLWKSDGTTAGTVLVSNVGPVSATTTGTNRHLTGAGGLVYFTASESTNGSELWRTDGTAAGTVRVADINPGTSDSLPVNLTALNGKLLFSADDGSHGR